MTNIILVKMKISLQKLYF